MDKDKIYVDCLAYQISLARRKITDFYNNKLRLFDLTPAYVYVLGVLKDDGPSTLTHIANVLQLERATMSTLLARMERDGFIIRFQGNERRTLRIELTPKGANVMKQALDILIQADTELDQLLKGNLSNIKQLISQINKTI